MGSTIRRLLGQGLMDHIRVRALGVLRSVDTSWESKSGRCIYLPKFDARRRKCPASFRGFGVQLYASAGSKGELCVSAVCFGEMLPSAKNWCEVDPNRRDRWGMPVLRIDCRHNADDLRFVKEQVEALRELGRAIGADDFAVDETAGP